MKDLSNKKSGYVVITLAVLFSALGLVLVLGGAVPVTSHYSSIQGYAYSKQSLLASDSGLNEVIYRLKTGKNVPATINVSLNTGSSTVTTTAIPGGKKVVVTGAQRTYQRKIQAEFAYGTGVSFHYGVQVGNGGLELQNSSTVTGNVYSNGTIVGTGNEIDGDVVSAGASGLIDDIKASGSAYAHTIRDSEIGDSAYYVTKVNTTVAGTSYPDSPDQATTIMPISDAQIAEWEDMADDGGSVTCTNGTYTVNSTVTLGPKKIPCNLVVSDSATLTVAGHIWVTGNITTQNSATIRMSSSLGSDNVAIIADNPGNPTGSGIISLGNSTTLEGSGSAGSYVFMISQNTHAESGGATTAINLVNSTSGDLIVYASHGKISLGNSVHLKEVTAHKIVLTNSANVEYESGLANMLFKSGPGGGYDLVDWFEF